MDFIDQLGKKLTLDVGRGTARDHEQGAYNILEANYSPVPFFMSTRGYGIFMHNSTPSTWDMGNTSSNSYSFSPPVASSIIISSKGTKLQTNFAWIYLGLQVLRLCCRVLQWASAMRVHTVAEPGATKTSLRNIM